VGSSKRVLQSDWKKEGIPFYRAREIVKLSDFGLVNNDLFISECHYNELKTNYGIPKFGDLMVTGVGTIGKVYIVKENDKFYYKDASVLCFANDYHAINSDFAKLLLESSFLQKQIHGQTYGNTVDTITISTANNYLFLLPPIKEQNLIVATIKKYTTYLKTLNESKENLIESIVSLKAKILDLAIRGKLVPQDPNDEPADILLEHIRKEKEELIKQGKIKRDKKESIIFKGDDNSYYEKINRIDSKNIDNKLPFNIPNSWTWCRLGNLIQVISGVSYDKKDVGNGNIRILRGGNINDLKVEVFDDDVFLPEEYYDNEKQLQKNDIVIVASTGSKEVIGKPGFITTVIEKTMIGAFLRIIRPFSSVTTNYIKLVFSSDYYRNHIRKLVHGNTINNIKTEYITDLIVPVPPQNEIVKIINLIKANMNLINKIEKSLN